MHFKIQSFQNNFTKAEFYKKKMLVPLKVHDDQD